MTTVSVKTKLPVPADKVWDMVGHFNALPDWHPAIESSKLEDNGKIRRLQLVGGGTIVERLERIDDSAQVYRYSIIESPLPVANYSSELRVQTNNDGTSTVEWSSEFNPAGTSADEAVKVIRGIYEAGFENLKKLFNPTAK